MVIYHLKQKISTEVDVGFYIDLYPFGARKMGSLKKSQWRRK